jgi:hypothetical protein
MVAYYIKVYQYIHDMVLATAHSYRSMYTV